MPNITKSIQLRPIVLKKTLAVRQPDCKWALKSLYEWRMNTMQCIFHHALFCYPKKIIKLASETWRLFEGVSVNSCEMVKINKIIYHKQ